MHLRQFAAVNVFAAAGSAQLRKLPALGCVLGRTPAVCRATIRHRSRFANATRQTSTHDPHRQAQRLSSAGSTPTRSAVEMAGGGGGGGGRAGAGARGGAGGAR